MGGAFPDNYAETVPVAASLRTFQILANSLGKLCELLGVSWLQAMNLNLRAVILPARQQVVVQMKHRLTRHCAIGLENVHSFRLQTQTNRLGDPQGSGGNRSVNRRVQSEQVAVMAFRDDQAVAGIDRVEIEKREGEVVFKHFGGGGAASNNLAKNARVVGNNAR